MFFCLAPGVGIEPTTNWLTANCSTAELPRNNKENLNKKIELKNPVLLKNININSLNSQC